MNGKRGSEIRRFFYLSLTLVFSILFLVLLIIVTELAVEFIYPQGFVFEVSSFNNSLANLLLAFGVLCAVASISAWLIIPILITGIIKLARACTGVVVLKC